ncbi:MAG: hypothetical protein AB1757_25130 [Acidobacteriota bacterium]
MWSEEQQREFKERIAKFSDEELLQIVCEDYDDYHETALQIAEAELNRRGIYLEDEESAATADEQTARAARLNGSQAKPPACAACGSAMRPAYLFAGKEVTVLFTDNNEERFVDVLACARCGQIKLSVDYATDVEG